MALVLVMGIPGSGKTTLCKDLEVILHLITMGSFFTIYGATPFSREGGISCFCVNLWLWSTCSVLF